MPGPDQAIVVINQQEHGRWKPLRHSPKEFKQAAMKDIT
jgi:hypothetical protein